MNVYAIILAGGTGTRMGSEVPKQYLKVNNKEIIAWTLEKFESAFCINKILLVIDYQYKNIISDILKKYNIKKFNGYAENGKTRQMSIYNGLKKLEKNNNISNDDLVIIHDACRPLLSIELINKLVDTTKNDVATMPVLTMKDTIYYSDKGKKIEKLLDRSKLYAGQTPECYNLKKYIEVHNKCSMEEIEKYKGSSEIMFANGYDVKFIDGEEQNFKITTKEDLKLFKEVVDKL